MRKGGETSSDRYPELGTEGNSGSLCGAHMGRHGQLAYATSA